MINLTVLLALIGLVSFLFMILLFVFFGNLIGLQFRRWRLAKKGYVEVEHISETNVRQYSILKPKMGKFDVFSGFYLYEPSALSKGGALLNKYSMDFLASDVESTEEFKKLSDADKEAFLKRMKAERENVQSMVDTIKNLNFKNEALSLKFGMSIITYYGDNPEPVFFKDKDKVLGSGVLKDLFLRLLMTQRYKDFQMMLIAGTIAIVVFALISVGMFYIFRGMSSDYSILIETHNITSTLLDKCLQSNFPQFVQNSTVLIK